MPAIVSQLDPRSPEFADNRAHLLALVEALKQRLSRAALGGGEKARTRHSERGKLLPRDRITALLDAGSPFLEIAPLAAEDMYGGQAPAAGLIAGIGRVHGLEVVVSRGLVVCMVWRWWCWPTTPPSRAAPTFR